LVVAAMAALVLATPVTRATDNGPDRHGPTANWQWLADTYWVVPEANLPAILFNPLTGRLVPVRDQTVYHITGYQGGYFWGKNVAQIGPGATPTCSSLVGSVTPEGRVLLSFTTVQGDGSVTEQQGFGKMTAKRGQWTMENQTSAINFAHWAYMVQSVPGDAHWHSLPGSGMAVPAFLGQCPGSGPQPVLP
jgi:hypothetical protein